MPDFNAFYESLFSDGRQEEEPMNWEDVPFSPRRAPLFLPVSPGLGPSSRSEVRQPSLDIINAFRSRITFIFLKVTL
ncbi:hypothetical protein TNIN_101221 [Trichonephila inaurata madagascariensis]|uniref:Uncharacterized protein n=1 Tax=Trichonephila inaurata madagascariensis TaxID=2747483 RepID=A0A8X6Y8U7_9ARAC|nr:hypothetical protein TNIN_101221 [Trichonephila inaurata madagascariensis]